jgi:hypothetical protein
MSRKLIIKASSLSKIAFPVPIDPELPEQAARAGLGFEHADEDTLPNLGKREQAGLDSSYSPSLPRWVPHDDRKTINFNGQNYTVLWIWKSADGELTKTYASAGRVPKWAQTQTKTDGSRLVETGATFFPGMVKLLNHNTGRVEIFSYLDVQQSLEAAHNQATSQGSASANQERNKYNEKLRALSGAYQDLSRAPLQLAAAADAFDQRTQELNSMLAAMENKQGNQAPEVYKQYEANLDRWLQSGQLSINDFKDTLFAKYAGDPAKLVQALESNSIQMPEAARENSEQIRQAILNLAKTQTRNAFVERLKLYYGDDADGLLGDLRPGDSIGKFKIPAEAGDPTEIRNILRLYGENLQVKNATKAPFDIMGQPVPEEITEVGPDSFTHRHRPDSFINWTTQARSLYAKIQSVKDERDELAQMANGLRIAAQDIGKMPAGSRGAWLKSPEASPMVQHLRRMFSHDLKHFVARYKEPFINPETGAINNKLLGTHGGVGNFAVGVVAARIMLVIQNILAQTGHVEAAQAAWQSAQREQ